MCFTISRRTGWYATGRENCDKRRKVAKYGATGAKRAVSSTFFRKRNCVENVRSRGSLAHSSAMGNENEFLRKTVSEWARIRDGRRWNHTRQVPRRRLAIRDDSAHDGISLGINIPSSRLFVRVTSLPEGIKEDESYCSNEQVLIIAQRGFWLATSV